ncbi:hypothetical protein LY76DRAFT_527934 [Colletotrichum caudatum]|nr:hypothetical protein LY76DRAFT_527934 [Colletotrichum caudatum]
MCFEKGCLPSYSEWLSCSMPPKASNIERQAWGAKCRKLLAEHIRVAVEASKVRLKTTRADPYAWSYRPAIAPLFERNLSTHSVGGYRKICAGIGQLFKAVPGTDESAEDESQVVSPSKPDISKPRLLTQEQLAEENRSLQAQVQELQEETDQKVQERRAEAETRLEAAMENCQSLQQELQLAKSRAEQLETIVSRYSLALSQIVKVTDQVVNMDTAITS